MTNTEITVNDVGRYYTIIFISLITQDLILQIITNYT